MLSRGGIRRHRTSEMVFSGDRLPGFSDTIEHPDGLVLVDTVVLAGDVGHWFAELERGETPGQQLVLELAAPTHLAHVAEVRVPHLRS